MPLELSPGPWVIGGDESAIPAIGTLLDALPDRATADVFIEAEDRDATMDTDDPINWLRRSGSSAPGSLLEAALTTTDIPAGARVWVACEATAVRRIRRQLLEAGSVSPERLVTRGYWRAGEANHPDHDYGED